MTNEQPDFIGNDKHFKLLRQALIQKDAAPWNEFSRSQGPQFRADLRGIDLTGCDLRGLDLRHARLEGAVLDGSDLRGLDLREAILTGATFKNANLEGTQLKVKARIRTDRLSGDIPAEVLADPQRLRRYKLDTLQKQAENLLQQREEDRKKKDKVNQHQVLKQSNAVKIIDDDDF